MKSFNDGAGTDSSFLYHDSQSKEILNFNHSFVASFLKAIFAQDGNLSSPEKFQAIRKVLVNSFNFRPFKKTRAYGFIREVEEFKNAKKSLYQTATGLGILR